MLLIPAEGIGHLFKREPELVPVDELRDLRSVLGREPVPDNGTPTRVCGPGSRCVYAVAARQGLLHDAGRSAAGPVHWPLCPAPLPPFVGDAGVAVAGAATASIPSVANATRKLRI